MKRAVELPVALLVDKSLRAFRFGNNKQKGPDTRTQAARDGQSEEVRVHLTYGRRCAFDFDN